MRHPSGNCSRGLSHNVQDTKIRKNYNKIANGCCYITKSCYLCSVNEGKDISDGYISLADPCGHGVIGSHVRLRI